MAKTTIPTARVAPASRIGCPPMNDQFMTLLLILTLSQGVVEIRSEGAYATHEACMERLLWRAHNRDFLRGDVAGACVPTDKLEGVIRHIFGSHA